MMRPLPAHWTVTNAGTVYFNTELRELYARAPAPVAEPDPPQRDTTRPWRPRTKRGSCPQIFRETLKAHFSERWGTPAAIALKAGRAKNTAYRILPELVAEGVAEATPGSMGTPVYRWKGAS